MGRISTLKDATLGLGPCRTRGLRRGGRRRLGRAHQRGRHADRMCLGKMEEAREP